MGIWGVGEWSKGRGETQLRGDTGAVCFGSFRVCVCTAAASLATAYARRMDVLMSAAQRVKSCKVCLCVSGCGISWLELLNTHSQSERRAGPNGPGRTRNDGVINPVKAAKRFCFSPTRNKIHLQLPDVDFLQLVSFVDY